jgi:hypothetical protein
MAQLKKPAGPVTLVTPKRSIKIDGILYVGGVEKPVNDSVRKKMQDADALAISTPGPSTVRTLLSDEAQGGRPRERVEGADDEEPFARTEEEDASEENADEDLSDDEEEVEEEVEEEDPVTKRKTKTTKKVKRSKRRNR